MVRDLMKIQVEEFEDGYLHYFTDTLDVEVMKLHVGKRIPRARMPKGIRDLE